MKEFFYHFFVILKNITHKQAYFMLIGFISTLFAPLASETFVTLLNNSIL